MWLELKNPHSVLAALRERPQDVSSVRLGRGSPKGYWREVAELATRAGIPVETGGPTPPPQGRRRRGTGGGRAAFCCALVRPRTPISVEQLFAGVPGESADAVRPNEDRDSSSAPQDSTGAGDGHARRRHRLWLGLDGLQDPQNVGAIFRTAAFFGVDGVVVTEHHSAPLSATVYDVASGGMEYVPFAVVPRLRMAVRTAKACGAWVLGTSEHAGEPLEEVDRQRDWFVLLGSEESGLRRLTRDECDEVRAIRPIGSGVTSLNVSVAAGIVLAVFRISR